MVDGLMVCGSCVLVCSARLCLLIAGLEHAVRSACAHGRGPAAGAAVLCPCCCSVRSCPERPAYVPRNPKGSTIPPAGVRRAQHANNIHVPHLSTVTLLAHVFC